MHGLLQSRRLPADSFALTQSTSRGQTDHLLQVLNGSHPHTQLPLKTRRPLGVASAHLQCCSAGPSRLQMASGSSSSRKSRVRLRPRSKSRAQLQFRITKLTDEAVIGESTEIRGRRYGNARFRVEIPSEGRKNVGGIGEESLLGEEGISHQL